MDEITKVKTFNFAVFTRKGSKSWIKKGKTTIKFRKIEEKSSAAESGGVFWTLRKFYLLKSAATAAPVVRPVVA